MTSVVAACPSREECGGAGGGLVASWAERLAGRARNDARGCPRVAFYGRVSTEDCQDPVTSRGPAGPAVRRYLLAGLIACGRCGRRLESCWSYGRPAYRCRHGYTSATVPDSARPKNT